MEAQLRPLIQQLYAAIEARELDALSALLADDVRWSSPAPVPGGGIRLGRAAVLEGAGLLFAAYPEVLVHLDDVQDDGDRVVVRGRYEIPGGAVIRFHDALTIRDERLAGMLSRFDGAALGRALRRAGR